MQEIRYLHPGLLAQQPSVNKANISQLLVKLKAQDWTERSEAFDALRSDAANLRSQQVCAALIDLLDRENRESPAESIENKVYAKNIDSGEDESDYREPLAETVAKIVDWSNPRQVCILAESVFLPDELADHAQVAVPCLLQRYKNSRPRSRGDVVAILVRILAKGKGDLNAATVREIQEIILSTLRNPDHDIKGDTIRALGKFGGEDMVPALRASADAETSNDAGSRSIRRRALQAIDEIEKRAANAH